MPPPDDEDESVDEDVVAGALSQLLGPMDTGQWDAVRESLPTVPEGRRP
jgi:hypothetical protein